MASSRRAFLGGLSSGMLLAGLGGPAAARSVLATRIWDGDPDDLDFGPLEALAARIQETPAEPLQTFLIEELEGGTSLASIVAATALANARAFGGHDYVGYHCQMALVPAWEMSRRLPEATAPLPVLKVVHRTAARIQAAGRDDDSALHALRERASGGREELSGHLRSAFEAGDTQAAERAFAGLCAISAEDAYAELQKLVQENLDVHRVVLSWRAWEVLPLTGAAHAETLLRQSVRFCVDAENERKRRGRAVPELRGLLPELLAEHDLEQVTAGSRRISDDELEELGKVILCCNSTDAARAMAEALAGGLSHEDAGGAISLAANALLLHDPGRDNDATPEKPRGSVHGASVGIHASDSARAWRHIARVSGPRNAAASLIAGAYHTAGQSGRVDKQPISYEAYIPETRVGEAPTLLEQLRAAVEAGDQKLAMAVAHCYHELGDSLEPLFDLLLDYAIRQDGALHAEKYFHTICEDFADSRPKFRRRHLVALARVTASQEGWEAPGVEAARERLRRG